MSTLQDQETAFQLLLDMVSLAQRDGEFHAKERQYIMKVGQRIGYQEDSLKDMMETKE
jgi:uncharacterized membrane protein YebE (DUF533 family)